MQRAEPVVITVVIIAGAAQIRQHCKRIERQDQ